ncbi:MAG: hypothetical protein CBC42_02245 [Betaproteobacteria bacterium TMED82]|nr:MAG: hypothetical protein CBC42_02245 [Betaproteobacteria bacterium TMED82]|tara:strand:- start:22436 stop:22882 length:447 start_codon:yes stop_codon:yes gene_type:complete
MTNFSEFLTENILLLSIAFASGALLLWPLIGQGLGVRRIGTLEATQLLNGKNAILVDLREDDNLSEGVIPQALRMPQSKFETMFEKMRSKFSDNQKKTKKPIILVGHSRHSSSKTENFLKQAGYDELFKLEGGTSAWAEAGLPVKKSS